jgi:hypothetical protein
MRDESFIIFCFKLICDWTLSVVLFKWLVLILLHVRLLINTELLKVVLTRPLSYDTCVNLVELALIWSTWLNACDCSVASGNTILLTVRLSLIVVLSEVLDILLNLLIYLEEHLKMTWFQSVYRFLVRLQVCCP